jgi:hypothetical protein
LVQDLRSRIGQDQGEAWRIGKSENKTRKNKSLKENLDVFRNVKSRVKTKRDILMKYKLPGFN